MLLLRLKGELVPAVGRCGAAEACEKAGRSRCIPGPLLRCCYEMQIELQ